MVFRLIEIVTKDFNTKFELDRVRKFRDQNSENSSIFEALNKSIENIKINIRWVEQNLRKITEWLKNESLAKEKKHLTLNIK